MKKLLLLLVLGGLVAGFTGCHKKDGADKSVKTEKIEKKKHVKKERAPKPPREKKYKKNHKHEAKSPAPVVESVA